MTETIETVNDEIVEEVFDEVAETATKSSNKFLCGIGVGIGLGIAIVEGCKHIVIPGINRLKEKCIAKKAAQSNCDSNMMSEDCGVCSETES